MNHNNIGNIYISNTLLKTDPDQVARILRAISFVPVRVEYLWSRAAFEYEGLSPHFRERTKGECVPAYKVEVLTDNGEVAVIELVETHQCHNLSD